MSFIAESLAAINAGLKAVELWEKYGPTSEVLQTLDLTYDPSEFNNLAKKIETSIDSDYDELFKATKERVRKCIQQLKTAADDETYMPEQRRKFGRAARMCVCREIGIIEDFLVGDIPEELKQLWEKHKCANATAPMAAGSSF